MDIEKKLGFHRRLLTSLTRDVICAFVYFVGLPQDYKANKSEHSYEYEQNEITDFNRSYDRLS